MMFNWFVNDGITAGSIARKLNDMGIKPRYKEIWYESTVNQLLGNQHYIGKVVWKEIQTAVLCGLALAMLCFVKIMVVDRMLLGNTDISTLTAFVVCATMAVTVLIAKLVGCTLPMAAKRVGFDPAVMASPFITTIVDALSLLVYFGIASALLF
jgi:Mg/Co/Ni transporter MgtE